MGHDYFTATGAGSAYKNQQAQQLKNAKNAQRAADTQAMVQMFSSLATQTATIWAAAKSDKSDATQAAKQTPMQQAQNKVTTAKTNYATSKAKYESLSKQLQMANEADSKISSLKDDIEALKEKAYGDKEGKVQNKSDGTNMQQLNQARIDRTSVDNDCKRSAKIDTQLKGMADVPSTQAELDAKKPSEQLKTSNPEAYSAQERIYNDLKGKFPQKQELLKEKKDLDDKYKADGGPQNKLAKLDAEIKNLENTQFDGTSKEAKQSGGTSCKDFEAQIKAKETELSKYQALKGKGEELKELAGKAFKEMATAEADLAAAEAEVKDIKDQAREHQQNIDSKKQDIKGDKSLKKYLKGFKYESDGSMTKRTWFQRTLGLNKGDSDARAKALKPVNQQLADDKKDLKNLKAT